MKKTAIILGAVLFLFTASVNAQNDSLPKQPTSVQTQTLNQADAKQPVTATNSGDRWNNWSPDKYKMLPMPEPLTTEKIFPVLGHYSVSEKTMSTATTTDATATENATTTSASSDVTITLDESNKGIVWVEGLPQGRIKAYLRKSPSTYMIPTQKTVDGKDLDQGVLIFDKDANTLDVCIGCKYNAEDPVSSLNPPAPVVEEKVIKTKKGKKVVKKVTQKPVTTFRYSGSKTDAATSSSTSTPMQQQ
jgi:hypothetical protein